MSPAAEQKIDVWRTILGAYRILAENFGVFARAAWLLVLIMTALKALKIYGIADGSQYLAILTSVVIFPLFTAIFAVMWHRLILLGEKPSGAFYWSLKKRVWQFLLWELLSMIPLAIAFAAISKFLANAPLSKSEMSTIIVAALVVLFLLFYARIQLLFPSIAIENPDLDIVESWRKTRGHTLQLAFTLFAAFIPLWAVFWLFYTTWAAFVHGNEITTAALPFFFVDTSFSFAAISITAGVFSLSYLQLIEGKRI